MYLFVHFLGIFEGRSPRYILCDPELIKTISVSDGDHFIDRNSVQSNEAGYSSRSLLALKVNIALCLRTLLKKHFISALSYNSDPGCSQQPMVIKH